MNIFNRMILICCLSFCSFLSTMDINQQLFEATVNGNLEQVQKLLYSNASVDARDTGGWTPLHLAAWEGHEVVVRLLLTHKASVDAIDKLGETPLHTAAIYGYETVVRLLLENNASVDATDQFVWTPLHLAEVYNKEAVTRLLLENNASIDAKDKYYGWTPLRMAAIAINDHGDVEKLLRRWPIYQKLVKRSQKKNLAFCCAQNSPLSSAYALPNELFYVICDFAKPTIEEADQE